MMRPEPKYTNPYLTSNKPTLIKAYLYRYLLLPIVLLVCFDWGLTIKIFASLCLVLYGFFTIIGVHYEWRSVILAMQTPFRKKILPNEDLRLTTSVKKETFYFGLLWIILGIVMMVAVLMDVRHH